VQRVAAPDLLEAADQRRVGGLQIQHLGPVTAGVQVFDHRGQIVGERPAAHVHHNRDPGHHALRAGTELDHGGDQLRRQVVDHEPAQVF
jgi:hypothetical protein